MINMAAGRGIVDGYRDGSFRTNSVVTRGQSSKMLVNTRQWQQYQGTDQVFADVPYGSTFYPFVMTAYNKGTIGGYTCGGLNEPCDSQNRPYFRPYSNLLRGHIIKMVDIAYTYPNALYSEPGPCW